MEQIKIAYVDAADFDTLKELPFIKAEDVSVAEQYVNKSDKALRLVSAYLKRKYVGEWSASESGKPISPDKYFNVSHCKGAVAIAVSDREVGIDIENIRSVEKKLKEYVANTAEIDVISTDEDFFRVWTAKESLVKAAGSGLDRKPKEIPALPLEGVKIYGEKVYFSRQTLISGMVLSVTLAGGEPFEPKITIENLL